MRDRQRISSYFLEEWRVLLAVTVFGLIYNLGLLAGPWFEGKMTGCLLDILDGRAAYQNMLILVGLYVAVKCVDIRRNTSGEGGLLDGN